MEKTGNQEPQYAYQKKTDFKKKAIEKEKEGHYFLVQVLTHRKNIILINIYAPIMGAHEYIQQIWTGIKVEIDGEYNNSRRF